MKKNRILALCALLCDLAILVCTVVFIAIELQSRLQRQDYTTFRYYTNDSNIFAAFSALCMLPCCVSALIKGEWRIPKWVSFLKFVGTSIVTVTFLTVLIFLMPIAQIEELFGTTGLIYLHGVGPVLAFISYCFLEKGGKLRLRDVLFAQFFTVIYSGIYLYRVVFAKTWPDFYGFMLNSTWVAPLIIMLLSAYAISFIIRLLHNWFCK